MSKLRLFLVACLLLALAAVPGFAQGTNGSFEGRVLDEQGGALPGASVTAVHSSTGFRRSAVTDASGVYRMPGLPHGTYELTVEMTGFSGQTHKGMIVNVGATTTTDFRLKLATQTEELTVVAESPLIDVKDSGVGEIVTTTQIENLPLNGRQFGNLAALVPGV